MKKFLALPFHVIVPDSFPFYLFLRISVKRPMSFLKFPKDFQSLGQRDESWVKEKTRKSSLEQIGNVCVKEDLKW